ncbi:outer membrane beta-barrel protein [Aquirufa regiilacus]
MKKVLFLCLITISAWAQTDTLHYTFGAYIESYYGHSLTNPQSREKSEIFYNQTTLNQPAVNLGLIEFSASKSNWTFRGDFMLGTYSQKNLASEPGLLKHIYQLNAQLQLAPKHQLIVGIMPSHIGLESAKNRENPSFSRSYIAENSPYYETGLAWSYSPTKRMNLKVLALTGWQTMHRFRPALGTQITIQNAKGLRFNSSGFIGDEGKGMRIFYDNYVQIPISSRFLWTLCQDTGFESGKFWHGGATFLTWKAKPSLKFTGRLEYFNDPQAIILVESLKDVSQSLTVDYELKSWSMLRTEFKHSVKWGNEISMGLLLNLSPN